MIISDTHVHFYPCHDLGASLGALLRNLGELHESATRVGILAEGQDHHFFRDLKNGSVILMNTGFEIVRCPDDGSILLRGEDAELYLVAGRQVVTSERLEILGLTIDGDIPGGCPVGETIEAIADAGGIPVLSWAPGKWFFERGRIVMQLIESLDPAKIMIGDTALRPTIWGEPALMCKARTKGFRICAGSDPLPITNEERCFGGYATFLEGEVDPETPTASIREALRSGPAPSLVGRRCGPLSVATRIFRHMIDK